MFADNSDSDSEDFERVIWLSLGSLRLRESSVNHFGWVFFLSFRNPHGGSAPRPLQPPILLPTNVSYVTNFPLQGLQKIVYDTRAGW